MASAKNIFSKITICVIALFFVYSPAQCDEGADQNGYIFDVLSEFDKIGSESMELNFNPVVAAPFSIGSIKQDQSSRYIVLRKNGKILKSIRMVPGLKGDKKGGLDFIKSLSDDVAIYSSEAVLIMWKLDSDSNGFESFHVMNVSKTADGADGVSP